MRQPIDSVLRDEYDHDTGRGRWAPVKSLFEAEELPLERLLPKDNIVKGVSLQDWQDKPL